MEPSRFTFLNLSQLIHHHLLWFLISAYAIAAMFPTPGLWIRKLSFGDAFIFGTKVHLSLVLILLATLMFNAGLGIRTAHLSSLLRKLGVLGAGLAANLLIPIGFILCVSILLALWHNPEEAQQILVGLALIAAMPIAGASTAWAQNSNGNLVLSLGLVLLSTIFSPIITPLSLYVFGEMASAEYETVLRNLADHGSGAFLGVWVVLPSLMGVGVRFAISGQLSAVMPYIKTINSLVLLVLNYSNASVSLPQAIAHPDVDFLALTFVITAGLCVTTFAAAYWLSCVFETDQADRISLMYGLGMNNNGTGLVLASLSLASFPRVMVPIIFYNLVQHVVAGSVHHVLGRKEAT